MPAKERWQWADKCRARCSRLLRPWKIGNIDLAREVVDREHKIDHRELDIDEAIFNLIAKRQPVGRDLRFILALSKVAGDLERAGDKAAWIAWCVIRLMEQTVQPLSPKIFRHIRELDRVVHGLPERSLNTLTRTDVDAAFDVLQAGLQLDSGFEAAISRVMNCVSEDVRLLDQVPNLVFILRALASIGDLASNIAEQVIFVIEGRDVRYQNKAFLYRCPAQARRPLVGSFTEAPGHLEEFEAPYEAKDVPPALEHP